MAIGNSVSCLRVTLGTLHVSGGRAHGVAHRAAEITTPRDGQRPWPALALLSVRDPRFPRARLIRRLRRLGDVTTGHGDFGTAPPQSLWHSLSARGPSVNELARFQNFGLSLSVGLPPLPPPLRLRCCHAFASRAALLRVSRGRLSAVNSNRRTLRLTPLGPGPSACRGQRKKQLDTLCGEAWPGQARTRARAREKEIERVGARPTAPGLLRTRGPSSPFSSVACSPIISPAPSASPLPVQQALVWPCEPHPARHEGNVRSLLEDPRARLAPFSPPSPAIVPASKHLITHRARTLPSPSGFMMATTTASAAAPATASAAAGLDFTAMPKIELHAHLSGSISRQCLHEVWVKKKAAGATDLDDPLVVMPPDKHDYDLKTFFPLFSSYIYHLVNDAASLEYTTKAVVADFARDGVVYLELRTTPRALPGAGLDKAGYVGAVLDALAAAQAAHPGLVVRLILSMDRRDTAAEAGEAVALAARFRARGVVGVDLCGDPARCDDVAVFAPAVRAARAAGLALTVHFAEAACSAGAAELDTLLGWAPDRLGHVIHVPDAVRRRIAATPGIGLELCLSCNVHAKMIVGGFEAHHFGEWWRVEGVVVVPCTDDVGVFGSPVSNEWRLIQQHFNLGRDEILRLARKGIDVIFGGEEQKQRLRELLW